MKYVGKTNEYFEIIDITNSNKELLNDMEPDALSFLWFESDNNELTIDLKKQTLHTNQIVCFTPFHKLQVHEIKLAKYLKFNKPFYCILDHDSEVGCKGVLYYGAKNAPILSPNDDDVEILKTVWKMILIEMQSKDNLQLEMLQMMLKRLLILCTRIYKSQENYNNIETTQVDIVRDFNFLVEQNFTEKHSVAEYASMLNKSPKTLSNLFGKLSEKTPLQIIQDRIMLEVRRLLKYTDKPVSEIGYEVGFQDIQSFSRFFKKNEGVSPSDFRST